MLYSGARARDLLAFGLEAVLTVDGPPAGVSLCQVRDARQRTLNCPGHILAFGLGSRHRPSVCLEEVLFHPQRLLVYQLQLSVSDQSGSMGVTNLDMRRLKNPAATE